MRQALRLSLNFSGDSRLPLKMGWVFKVNGNTDEVGVCRLVFVSVLKAQHVSSACGCLHSGHFSWGPWQCVPPKRTFLECPTSLSSHVPSNVALRRCDQSGPLMALFLPRLEYVQQMMQITPHVFLHRVASGCLSETWGIWITLNMTFDSVNALKFRP